MAGDLDLAVANGTAVLAEYHFTVRAYDQRSDRRVALQPACNGFCD